MQLARDLLSLGLFPALPDGEVERQERLARANDALVILDQIPAALRRRGLGLSLQRSCTPGLASAAAAWRPDRNFVALGLTGVGKSTAAAWMLRRVVATGVQRGGEAWDRARCVRWYPAVEFERARLEHKLGQGEAPEVARAQRASVLVIDDAGQDRDAGAVREVLAARYDASLPTILGTNLTRAGLEQHYGAACVRKLLESGGKRAVVVDLHGAKQ